MNAADTALVDKLRADARRVPSWVSKSDASQVMGILDIERLIDTIDALLAENELLRAVRDAAKDLYAVVLDRLDADQTLVLYRLVDALDAAEEAK